MTRKMMESILLKMTMTIYIKCLSNTNNNIKLLKNIKLNNATSCEHKYIFFQQDKAKVKSDNE